MSLTDKELIRLKLSDPLKPMVDNSEGDGTSTIFVTTHGHVQDLEVRVDGVITTDYTLEPNSGTITLATAPGDGKNVRMAYNYAAFSDVELDALLEQATTVNKTLVECVNILLMDASRRFDYSEGQTSMKPSQIFDHLKSMRDIFKDGVKSEASGGGMVIAERTSSYYTSPESTSADLSRADLGIE
jgi:hypothetical protein